jgi:hypothetical protein
MNACTQRSVSLQNHTASTSCRRPPATYNLEQRPRFVSVNPLPPECPPPPLWPGAPNTHSLSRKPTGPAPNNKHKLRVTRGAYADLAPRGARTKLNGRQFVHQVTSLDIFDRGCLGHNGDGRLLGSVGRALVS